MLLLGGALAPAQGQAVSAEDGFVARIAQDRAARGLPPLSGAADLQAVARRHAQRMADRGEPYHNPDLATEVQGWSMLAENVGVGPDVGMVHDRFMASDQHRSSILSPDLTELGVGVVQTADGQLWVVEVFRRPATATASPAPSPAPTPVPATPAPAPPPPPPAPTTTTTPPATVPPPAAPVTSAPPAATVAAPAEAMVARSPAPALLASAVAPDAALPTVPELARRIPPAAAVAAFLLAAVVALQGVVLRRLELVR